jgi:hypothetical protein
LAFDIIGSDLATAAGALLFGVPRRIFGARCSMN